MSKEIGIFDPKGINKNPLTDEDYSDNYRRLATYWSTFPAYKKADEVLKSIMDNQMTFIVSGTGSGKTVLVPKLALHYTDYKGKIGITLPKRNVTLSAAEFAAETLDVELGGPIGYAFKNSPPKMKNKDVKMLYMTDGTLFMHFFKDPYLTNFQVIIIDEAHERKVMIDFLMLFLKNLLLSGKRPDLKVIIMSATIDSAKYQQYFSGITSRIVHISGLPNHEITTHFLDRPTTSYISEGFNMIDSLIKKGIRRDMLFFITTSSEAIQFCKMIKPKYSDVFCIEVYSDMDSAMRLYAQQADKFRELGPYNQKLVVATNVAESSITIDGLKYVIDSGYELYSYFNPESYSKVLEKRLITKAQALQRRGRVGRTEPGICYHLLTEKQFDSLEEFPAPDILRQDITLDFLSVIKMSASKSYTEGLATLMKLMDPPTKPYLQTADKIFKLYNLIDEQGIISKISTEIVQFTGLPINRCLFLIYAYQLYCAKDARIAKDACIIVAMIEQLKGKITNMFYKAGTMCESSCKKSSVALVKKVSSKKGDHITYLKMFNEYKTTKEPEKWAKQNNIKLGLFKKVAADTRKYYGKLMKISKAPQLSRAENTSTTNKIMNALRMSHKHLIAKDMTAQFPSDKKQAQINKDSALLYFHKPKDLISKQFIYDELNCINGNWEFNIVTLI